MDNDNGVGKKILEHGNREEVAGHILRKIGREHELFARELTDAMFVREGKPFADRMKIENARLATECAAYLKLVSIFNSHFTLLEKFMDNADLVSFYAAKREIKEMLNEARAFAKSYSEQADHRNHPIPEFPPEWNV